MFNAILIQKKNDAHHTELTQIDESQLPDGDVTIQIEYSSLNYKDALAISGKGPVVKTYPMVPGIDLAGKFVQSKSTHYQVGDSVLLNGWGIGEKHWGGLSEIAKVNSEWLIPLPRSFTSKQCMIIGTAGYTAMLCIIALEKNGITPNSGKVLVTGANGGVGSFAIWLLSRLGYHVIASTGRVEESDYLINQLGAKEIIDRHTLSEPAKPLMKTRWIAAIDSVGSHTLANVCASTAYGGTVAACGLAQGMDFSSSVAPFILRGVTLAGIDSVMRPYQDRIEAWDRLVETIDKSMLEKMSHEISLNRVIAESEHLLAGKVRGRIVVRLM